MGPFNNREIAIFIWLLLFIAFVLRKADVRKSLKTLVWTFCKIQILTVVSLMLLYVVLIVLVLRAVGVWEFTLFKDTVVWFCAALGMMMRFNISDKAENVFRKVLVDSVKVVILLEFLVNTYTFSLPIELVFLPLVTFIAILDAFASEDEKYCAVSKLTTGVLTVVGCVIMFIVVNRAISDLRSLQSWDTFRSIMLAPSLSMLLTPFIYIVVLVSKYELVFMRLGFGINKSKRLERYARRRIIMHARLNLKRVQHLLTNHPVDLMHIQNETDVERLFEGDAESSGRTE